MTFSVQYLFHKRFYIYILLLIKGLINKFSLVVTATPILNINEKERKLAYISD